jgi:hypothetical protein
VRLLGKTKHTAMKTLSTIIFLFLAATVVAQTKTALPKEFSIDLSQSNLNVKPGDQGQVTVSIVRSKAFAKGSVKLSSASTLPEGITLQFEPAEGLIESSVATLTVATNVAPNTYNIVINGVVHHKNKGTILKLVVANEMVVSK